MSSDKSAFVSAAKNVENPMEEDEDEDEDEVEEEADAEEEEEEKDTFGDRGDASVMATSSSSVELLCTPC